jgi:hypothetical protein
LENLLEEEPEIYGQRESFLADERARGEVGAKLSVACFTAGSVLAYGGVVSLRR